MHIGHYAPQLWAPGGIATYVRRLGAAQTARGHRVHYLSAEAPVLAADVQVASEADLFGQVQALGLDVLHLHKPVRQLPGTRLPVVRTLHGNQAGCPSGTRYLARSGQPCDRAYSLTGCLWGHLADHCGSRRPANIRASFASIRREHEQAARLHTCVVSAYVKEQLVRAGCSAERVHVLRSPAPDRPYEPAPPVPDGPPRFVFLGRLTPQKGVDWLLHAASRVDIPLRLDIAGDGPERPALERLAARLGVADRTTFHGWLDPDAVQHLLACARAVVVPSVWHEPAGLVTLEAAAAGRVAIASRVGGIPEYAEPLSALLVPPRDVPALAAALERLAADAARADQLGRSAQTAVRERFAMYRFLEHQDRVYAWAQAEAGRTPRPLSRAPSALPVDG